ncbi:PE family protein [Mycobacterium terramassiliense]|uniref:PE family protein n=1 Tax=Mycobacterium terramassiliense TaxID=1841859 RepID=A0A2U3NK70_9MYCO|nr:PE family protein [Mycobacterium terramassiliense]SPM31939.1 PE family protein [Mycobacterium terramassiliense]
MSFVITQPEAMTYAAGKLQTLGSAIAAESAAAAAPTTGVVPAAADEVSALQATIFAAYGSLYQSINDQATAIHELFVNTLGASSGAYTTTESLNSVATASPFSQQISGLFGAAANAAQAESPPGSALANIVDIGFGNWGSATSDLLGMTGGGILPAANETGEIAAVTPAGADGTVLTGAPAPTAPAGLGALPAAPGLGQALPPSWTADTGPASPGAVTTAGWTAPVPQSAPATTVPAAVPAVATAGKAAGLGAPRYGVKPTVMARPTGV